MAKVGGKRPGAGRPRGARNKVTAEVKAAVAELAKPHAHMAIETLVSICRDGESDAARVSAAQAILDRAYGKPVQAVEHGGSADSPLQVVIRHFKFED